MEPIDEISGTPFGVYSSYVNDYLRGGGGNYINDYLDGLRYDKNYIQIMEGDKIIDTIKEIEIPSNFKTVIMKLHPEIKDVVEDGFKSTKRYDPNNFDAINYFEVGVKVFFGQDEIPKGNKDFYKESFKDLFMMTYGSEMDFISFNITSLVVPRAKSNEEKFLELFKKDYICKK